MKQKYKVLDLFSGLGGFSLGLERTGHFETVAFCDNDKFSKAILDKHWKGIKVYDDVREITKEKFKEDGIEFPDIITGGFPCQPFSVAGKQKGTSDDRHLWPEMFRIIKTFKPRFAIGENVRGIVNIQDGVVFETVCTDLESEGYEVQPFNIPAAGVGAPHRRERIWFIAIREESVVNSDNIRFKQHSTTKEETSWRGTSATFESTSNVGNSKYNGSPTSEIGRGHEEINGGTEKRQNESFEFERTSRSEDNGNLSTNVADTENRRGQPSQPERWEGTKRGSIDRGGIEREGQNFSRTEGNKNNVADTNDEGLRTCIGGSDNDHATESRSGGVDRTRSESDVERHNSTSTEIKGMDVADTESLRFRGRSGEERGIKKNEFQQTEQKGSSFRSETERRSSQSGGDDVADTNTRFGNGENEEIQPRGQTFDSSSARETSQGWWSVEPNVGRVAHGVSGRVHRLKGLGNSIVPQIVEEIGKALIKAEQG